MPWIDGKQRFASTAKSHRPSIILSVEHEVPPDAILIGDKLRQIFPQCPFRTDRVEHFFDRG